MGWTEFKQIKGLQIITSDGFYIGNVSDMKFAVDTWKIKGLRMTKATNFKMIEAAVSPNGKPLMSPSSKYTVADVLLTNISVKDMKPKIQDDSNDNGLLSGLYGKKIMTSQKFLIGTIESIQVDKDAWRVLSFTVKLDKEAHKPLGIKKLLFSKSIAGVQTDFVSSVSEEEVKLKLTIDELKKQVIIDE